MLEKMRPIIAEQLNVQESEIKENTKLKEDLGADSLDLFELVICGRPSRWLLNNTA